MLPRILSLRSELASGIWPSVHRAQVPLWQEGQNIEFTANGVRKIRGWDLVDTTAAADPIRGAGQLTESDGSKHIYFGDMTTLYRWDGSGSIVDVAGAAVFTGNEAESDVPATSWSMFPFGDWMLATNGKDTIQVIKGSAVNTATLGGIGGNFSSAEIVTVLNEHAIVLNTDNSPYEIRWSTAGNPEIWTPDATNTAGFLSLREARSPIVAAVRLGGFIAIYTKESLFLLKYVGSPTVRFQYLHAINGIGAVSKHAVVSLGAVNYGLGPQGFWKTDGQSFAFIDDPAVRKYVEDNKLTTQMTKTAAYHNEAETSIIWYIPVINSTQEPSVGLVYNYSKEVWSIRTHARTSAIERDAFSNPYSFGSAGQLYKELDGFNDDSNAITAYIRTKGLDFGDETLTKYITGVRVNCIESGSLNIRVGYTNHDFNSTITWTSYKNTLNGDIIPFRVAGKLIYIEIQSQSNNDLWEIFGLDVFGRVAGTKETGP